MKFRELTADEKVLLKLGIISLHENGLISRIAASQRRRGQAGWRFHSGR